MNTHDRVAFQNPGEIDEVLISTLGTNVKETENPIGYFGTGLKYAIAVLLRLNHEIVIWSGEKRYDFAVDSIEVRGKTFEIVTINGQRLGFTTDLGKNWKLWQVLRELLSNCVDEGGEHGEDVKTLLPKTGYTTVVVHGSGFRGEYLKRDLIFLASRPVYEHTFCEVHPGMSQHLYYRGVRAYDLEKPSKFTYNVLHECDLTEDRTLDNQWLAEYYIREALAKCQDEEILEEILLSRDSYETSLNFSTTSPGETFLRVGARLSRDRMGEINSSIDALIDKHADFVLERARPVKELSAVEQQQLDVAIAFVNDLLEIDCTEYPIVVVQSLGGNVYGLAKTGTIYLSRLCFNEGTKFLASTLFEEWVHLKYGYRDTSRSLQTYLFNQVITLGERLRGDPL